MTRERTDVDTAKTPTLAFRIEPWLRGGLREAASGERRCGSNMVQMLIRDCYGRSGIAIAVLDGDQPVTSGAAHKKEPCRVVTDTNI